MILQYVASDVSKWQDAYSNDAIFSTHIGPHQAAYRHVRTLKPLEPEMWLALSSIKMSWLPSQRKKLSVPPIQRLHENRTYQKNLSFLQWLRQVDETKQPPLPYTDGSTLVGIKMVSPFKDSHYLQYLLLHHPQHDHLLLQIRYFAAAYSRMNNFWSNAEQVRTYFSNQQFDTIVFHIQSMSDFLCLWQ